MERRKFKHTLEIVTNIAVLAVAILIIWTFIGSYFTRRSLPPLQSGLQKGMPFTQLPGISYSDSPQTLIVAMNTQCHYCKESIPFYRRLAEQQAHGNKATRIVAVFPNSQEEVDQYLKENQLNLATVTAVDLSKLSLSGTPTMILVDSDGKIRDFWAGRLPDETEKQIVNALADAKEYN